MKATTRNKILDNIVIEQDKIKELLNQTGIPSVKATWLAGEIIHNFLLGNISDDEYQKVYMSLNELEG